MSKKTDKEIQSCLASFGLNETEGRIYASLLETGGGQVNEIAKLAGIKRTTTYSSINELIKKGLARFDEFGLKRKVVAEDPKHLERMLEEQKNKLQQTLPSLESLFNLKGNQSFIRYYKGIKAIKPVYETLIRDIRPNEEYFVLSNQELWLSHDEQYFEDFSFRRAKLPIKIKMILQRNASSEKYFKMQKQLNAEIKYLPQNIDLKTNLVVTPKRAVLHQLVQPVVALVIENETFITMYQEMFRMIWNSIPDSK